jgi:hypothetical protein
VAVGAAGWQAASASTMKAAKRFRAIGMDRGSLDFTWSQCQAEGGLPEWIVPPLGTYLAGWAAVPSS